jgi:hypothetical protein
MLYGTLGLNGFAAAPLQEAVSDAWLPEPVTAVTVATTEIWSPTWTGLPSLVVPDAMMFSYFFLVFTSAT